MSDHQDVGLTAGLQQGQGARIMAAVYSLVQSCFTILQHNFFFKNEAFFIRFQFSFNLIYVDRPSDGIYHSLPAREEEPGRSYHEPFPCQRWLSGRKSFPDITVSAWRWAIHGASGGLAPEHTHSGRACLRWLPTRLTSSRVSKCSSSRWMVSKWPLLAAKCRGVSPVWQGEGGREARKEGGRMSLRSPKVHRRRCSLMEGNTLCIERTNNGTWLGFMVSMLYSSLSISSMSTQPCSAARVNARFPD